MQKLYHDTKGNRVTKWGGAGGKGAGGGGLGEGGGVAGE